MHRILIEIARPHFALRSYPALILLAVVVCLWLGPWVAARLEGLNRRRVLGALTVLGLVVFAGARLHFVLVHWRLFSGQPHAFLTVWAGGLHAGGAIASLALAAPLVLRAFGLPLGKFADGFAPTLGVGIALARLGCFLQGCCFGTLCPWPWGVTFPQDTYIYQFHRDLGVLAPSATRTAPIHPLQLYFAAAGLLITAVALWLHPRKRYDGHVGLVALALFSASSAVLEFFRADYYPRVYWGPLPQLEWVALGLTLASLIALTAAELVSRR